MKKILQDLAYGELESLILSLGEKKFRVRQAYDGLMRGKKISQIHIICEKTTPIPLKHSVLSHH